MLRPPNQRRSIASEIHPPCAGDPLSMPAQLCQPARGTLSIAAQLSCHRQPPCSAFSLSPRRFCSAYFLFGRWSESPSRLSGGRVHSAPDLAQLSDLPSCVIHRTANPQSEIQPATSGRLLSVSAQLSWHRQPPCSASPLSPGRFCSASSLPGRSHVLSLHATNFHFPSSYLRPSAVLRRHWSPCSPHSPWQFAANPLTIRRCYQNTQATSPNTPVNPEGLA
jgi:hypothetical protein